MPPWFGEFGINGEPLKSPHHAWFKIRCGELTLHGTPDEILKTPGGKLIIIDYKTARYKEADSFRKLYEVQLNVYARIAENLSPPRDPFPGKVQAIGLMYYDPITEVEHPDKIGSQGFLMEFRACWVPVERQDSFLDELLERAWAILSREKPPASNGNCKTCEAYEMIASVLR
ncbi:MAG: PD-(D/E)XK nuclease family protein [Armatimonadetes bacterium]|nr:PD-(D/E)XK nuclease family protein [Armatimonadota bacterium]